ncbi:hypothetical protein NRIC_09210 [Enterococcus florum]|uniref:Uncharacterized protein n=2 Tax=Enterococcus florum TaxID=2480627 RepID=A0A4P5P5R2_9ENTE|nr:hypothetical protein NRIC_09210 [Enterococcus florum]
MDYSANGFAEIMLETQTSDETNDYFEEKTNDLIEGIEENNEKLDGVTTNEKSLKEDIEEYNTMIIKALHDFLNNDTESEASFKSGQKLTEIVDQYFDGRYPKKVNKLLDYYDNFDNETLDNNETLTDFSTSPDLHVAEQETSNITIMSEIPSSEQTSILSELAQQQFSQEFPYKGSKIHSVLGIIQDWTVSGEQWYYKAEATIVNESGAKRNANVEIHITPTSANSGIVTITAY